MKFLIYNDGTNALQGMFTPLFAVIDKMCFEEIDSY